MEKVRSRRGKTQRRHWPRNLFNFLQESSRPQTRPRFWLTFLSSPAAVSLREFWQEGIEMQANTASSGEKKNPRSKHLHGAGACQGRRHTEEGPGGNFSPGRYRAAPAGGAFFVLTGHMSISFGHVYSNPLSFLKWIACHFIFKLK